MEKINFKIVTPEKVVFSEQIDQITMMTKDGEITVLAHHVPLVSVLKPGEMRYKKDGQEYVLAVSGGFVEIKPDNSVVILADTAEQATEIDITRAEAAKAKAEKLMSEARSKEDVDYVAIQVNLEKALNRLKVGQKYRKLPQNPQK